MVMTYHKCDTAHERHENLWHSYAVSFLIRLKQAANGTARGAERRVEHVHILFLAISHLLDTAADLHSAGLVVGAVGTRDKFAVGVVAGEPALEIEFLDGGIVESTAANVDDVVGKSERLVKLLGRLDHFVLHLAARL